MVYANRKIRAHASCNALELTANRLVRYCGSVIASSAALEKVRRRFAQRIQLAAVPKASPIPIHICPNPKAKIDPGRPISSHADISDACADSAVTHGPMDRPPRKKSSEFLLVPLK